MNCFSLHTLSIYWLKNQIICTYILFSTIFWPRNNSWQRNASIFKFQLTIIFASSIIIRFEIRPILAISNSLARFLTFFPRWLKVMKSTNQNVSSSKSKIVDGACTYLVLETFTFCKSHN